MPSPLPPIDIELTKQPFCSFTVPINCYFRICFDKNYLIHISKKQAVIGPSRR